MSVVVTDDGNTESATQSDPFLVSHFIEVGLMRSIMVVTRRGLGTLRVIGLAIVATAAQSPGDAWAALITLQSGVSPSIAYQTQDAHVRNDNLAQTDNNTRIVFGSLAGASAGKSLRGLYSYPLTDIPAGATIDSVTFTVVQVDADSPASTGGDVTVELRSVSQGFSQGTGTGGTGGANWNNTFGAAMTLSAAPLSVATMNPNPLVVPAQATPSTWITTTFPSTPDFVAAVQSQLDANLPFNFSLLLPPTASGEGSGVRRVFRTPSNSEVGTGAGNRPILTINYTVPEPTAIICILMGAGLMAACWRRPSAV